ncbi:MAG: hypothetical protein GKR89_18640 [Candidatus Latescibacteria bacterium]|nr:hypothetical protein [Candidatus Latescibacterota bacterium]
MRISKIEDHSGQTALQIEGDLAGEEVGALAEEVGPLLDRQGALTLDLAGVRFIGPSGLLLLRRLCQCGLRLRRPSRFVLLLMRQHGLDRYVETNEAGKAGFA